MSRSGPTSFGYRRVNGRLVFDKSEAQILKRIFELFFEHQRKKIVAEILAVEKATTRNGSNFTGQSIGRLLTNDIVLGRIGEIDPLIPQTLFENVQNILANQKGRATRKTAHLFTGFAICGCGHKMYIVTGSHKYGCQNCKAKIHASDLEAVFITKLRAHYESLPDHSSNIIYLLDMWSILELPDKRAILESTTEHIEIRRNSVTLSLISLYKT